MLDELSCSFFYNLRVFCRCPQIGYDSSSVFLFFLKVLEVLFGISFCLRGGVHGRLHGLLRPSSVDPLLRRLPLRLLSTLQQLLLPCLCLPLPLLLLCLHFFYFFIVCCSFCFPYPFNSRVFRTCTCEHIVKPWRCKHSTLLLKRDRTWSRRGGILHLHNGGHGSSAGFRQCLLSTLQHRSACMQMLVHAVGVHQQRLVRRAPHSAVVHYSLPLHLHLPTDIA